MTEPKTKESWDNFTERMGREIGKAAGEAEKEAERIIDYINSDVVPAVREHSTRALRVAAQKLGEFAEYLDDQKKKS